MHGFYEKLNFNVCIKYGLFYKFINKIILLAIQASIADIYLLYKAEKLAAVSAWIDAVSAWIDTISAWIDARLAQNESYVLQHL